LKSGLRRVGFLTGSCRTAYVGRLRPETMSLHAVTAKNKRPHDGPFRLDTEIQLIEILSKLTPLA
jgi:hypothetical protein